MHIPSVLNQTHAPNHMSDIRDIKDSPEVAKGTLMNKQLGEKVSKVNGVVLSDAIQDE